MFLIAIGLSAFIVVTAALRIESGSPAFPAGRSGCISALTSTNGASVVTWDCNLNAEQDWIYTPASTGAQPLKIFGNKCLDVKDGLNADGTDLQLWDCVNQSPNQLWISVADSTLQWAGTNKCVDLTNGNITNGNPLQIWTCVAGNDNQKWSSRAPTAPTAGVRLISGGGSPHTPFCMAASENHNYANVALASCTDVTSTFPAGNLTWVIPSIGEAGPITTFDGSKCLSLRGATPGNGNLVMLLPCGNGDINQQWIVNGPDTTGKSISWAGGNKCADVTNGVYAPGTNLQVWDCDAVNNRNQWWSVL